MEPINLAKKLDSIDGVWVPRTVATVNDYDVRVVKILGEFVRHQHEETDEMFLVLDGEMEIRMDEGSVWLRAGECYVVPAGVHHQPCAAQETRVLLFEPSSVVNTGDAGGELTQPRVEI